MSGVTAATIIAGIGAAAAVGSTAYAIKSGSDAASAQQEGLKKQQTAQDTAKSQALSTQRKSELAQNAANMKTPDIASILLRAAGPSKSGLGSTMLTGPGGVNAGDLTLGKSSLLGT